MCPEVGLNCIRSPQTRDARGNMRSPARSDPQTAQSEAKVFTL